MGGSGDWRVEGVSEEARATADRSAEAAGTGTGAWVDAAILAAPGAEAGEGGERAAALLRMLEARISEQDERMMTALQPLADSLAALDARLQALEADDSVFAGEPRAAELPAEPDLPTDTGAGFSVPAGPQEEGTVRLAALFGRIAPSEDELREADAAVESDLKGLFDDGRYAGRTEGAGFDGAPLPASARSRRGTLTLLGVVSVLLLIAAGIVAFVWSELASPLAPPPPEEPLAAATREGAAEPPAPPDASVADEAHRAAETAALPPAALEDVEPPAPERVVTASESTEESPALRQLRAAAEAGDPRAQNDLALRYLVGDGVPQDYTTAARWLKDAAAAGVTSAQYNLGVLYDSGRGVEADPVEALIWFHTAAEKGHGRAQYALAAAYAAGRGIERNSKEALRWLERASNADVLEAQTSLASILATGPRTREQLADAMFWYRIADANGAAGAGAEAERVAVRLTAEERGAVNRRVSRFLSERLARISSEDGPAARATKAGEAEPPPPPAEAPAAASATATAEPPAVVTAMPTAETVQRVQSLLAILGFDPGPADGVMGAQTRSAIAEYQREFGMAETGEATPELLQQLREVAGIAD